MAAVTVFAMTGCEKEHYDVDLPQIAGTWSLVDSDSQLETDSKLTYTFDKGEGNEQPGYTMVTRDAISGDEVTHTGTYVIGTSDALHGRTYITMTEDGANISEEWQVIVLTSRDMKWRVYDHGGKPTEQSFVKVAD